MKTTTFYNFITGQNLLFVLLFIFYIETLQAQTTPEVLWAKQFGGSNMNDVMGVDIDESENIYIAGIFGLETSIGDITLTTTYGVDSFVAKTDSSGNVLWAKQFEGTFNTIVQAITTDNLGYIYTSGYFLG